MNDLCGAKKKNGETCKAAAGRGTDHPGIGACKHHGGGLPNHKKAARKVMAARAAEQFGVPVVTTPEQALVDALHAAQGLVEYYLAEISKDFEVRGADALVENTDTGQKPSVFVEQHAKERANLAKLAEVCIKLGLEERRVAVDEQAAGMVVRVIERVLLERGVRLDDDVKGSVTRHLLELSA